MALPTLPPLQIKKATLVGPKGERVAVEVGSQDAQQYFGKGFKLETSAPKAPQAPTTSANPPQGSTLISGPSGLQGLNESQIYRAPGSNDIYKLPEQPKPAPTYAQLATQVLQKGAEKAKADMLGAPDSYDRQITEQEAALWAKLGGKDLTPDEMKWLTPAQSNAILNGDQSLIRNQLAALNTIKTGRKELRKEEQDKIDKENAKKAAQAATAFEIYSKNNLWDSLSSTDRSSLETSLGLPSGTIDALSKNQSTDLYDYKYSAGTGNSLVELVTDKKTGKMVSTRTIGSTVTGGVGGGLGTTVSNGFTIPQTQTVQTKQTFEEFIAEKEREARQSFSQSKRDELRAEYDSKQKGGSDKIKELTDQFESVVINLGSVTSQKNARNYFQSLISQGDTEKMKVYLDRLALDGLSGKSLSDYNSMGTVLSGANAGLAEINTFSSLNPGLYKTAVESTKPFLNVSKDQKWVNFTSKIEASQAEFINNIYGANLTGGELERANRYLIDFSRDNAKTIETKLKNLKQLASDVRNRLLNEQKGVFTDLTLNSKPSLDSFVSPITDFISP